MMKLHLILVLLVALVTPVRAKRYSSSSSSSSSSYSSSSYSSSSSSSSEYDHYWDRYRKAVAYDHTPQRNELPYNVGSKNNDKCGPYMLYQWVKIRSKPKPDDHNCYYATCSKLIPVEKNCNGGCSYKSKYKAKGYNCRDKGRPEDKLNKAWVRCEMVCGGYGYGDYKTEEVYIEPKHTNIYYQTVSCGCTDPRTPLSEDYTNYDDNDDDYHCDKDCHGHKEKCPKLQGISMRQLATIKRRCAEDVIGNNPLFLGDVVRFGFHDCMGPDGCNGCVDVDFPPNKGLEIINGKLNEYYDKMINDMGIMQEDFTRGDWYAICGVAAAEIGFKNSGSLHFAPEFKFKIGRPSIRTCVDKRENFPDAEGTFADIMAFFQKHFKFNQTESVLILGAHSLGVTERGNGGFCGPWTGGIHRLDNDYYKVLLRAISDKWKQRALPFPPLNKDIFQWNPIAAPDDASCPPSSGQDVGSSPPIGTGSGGDLPPGPLPPDFMMLNSDMVLVKDFKVDGFGDHGRVEPNCRSDASQCPNAPTHDQVIELANDNELFTRGFVEVWTKMLEKVRPGVELRFPYDYDEDD